MCVTKGGNGRTWNGDERDWEDDSIYTLLPDGEKYERPAKKDEYSP